MNSIRHIFLYAALICLGFGSGAGMARAQALLGSEAEKVFEVVEEPPIPWLYKTQCLDIPSADRRDCYMQKLSEWLTARLEYPDKAMEAGTEGLVVVQFVIDKRGAIRDAEVIRDIGNNCGAAALKVINRMPDWVPGRQRGVPVNVRYSLPVKFELRKR